MKMNPADVLKLVKVLAENMIDCVVWTRNKKLYPYEIPMDFSLRNSTFWLSLETDLVLDDVVSALNDCGFHDTRVRGNAEVMFSVGANDDDIRAIMDAAIKQRKQTNKARGFDVMGLEVAKVVRCLNAMRPGIFHSGVNALKMQTLSMQSIKDHFNKQR